MYELSLKNLGAETLEEAASAYASDGVIILTDTEEQLLPMLEDMLRDKLSGLGYELDEVLDGTVPLYAFSEEQRKTLSQINTSTDLQTRLVNLMEPVLLRLLGPLVHVSSNFHAQFKGADLVAPPVDHGGYPTGTKFYEAFGQYLLHQDFTGARLPTSPSGMTLWVPSTTGENWGLRVYPGSHRRGIMCNEWIELDDERLEILGEHVDLAPKRGQALLFHALLLHSSVFPGPDRRVSIDVRFFPLCGYLPSAVWSLGEGSDLEFALSPTAGDDEILASSKYEALAFLGRETGLGDTEDHSILNWVRYVEAMCGEDPTGAIDHLKRFTNTELIGTGYEVYRDKYHEYPMNRDTIDRAKAAVAAGATDKTGDGGPIAF